MAAEGGAWPSSLRPIGKYLARASEIETTEPIVSYYCTLYSLKTALRIRDKNDANASKLVTSLLTKCEQESAKIGNDQDAHQNVVQDYAIKVFRGADDEDRAGNATLETAKTFYSAMCFLEVCKNFGELNPDLQERLKYAKYKVATITKAIREGRKPVPGPPPQDGKDPALANAPNADGPNANAGGQAGSPPTNVLPSADAPVYPATEPEPLSQMPNGTGSPMYPQPTDLDDASNRTMPHTGTQPLAPSESLNPHVPLTKNESGAEDFASFGNRGGYPSNPPPYPSQEEPSPLNSYNSPYGTNASHAPPSAPPPGPATPPVAPHAPPTSFNMPPVVPPPTLGSNASNLYSWAPASGYNTRTQHTTTMASSSSVKTSTPMHSESLATPVHPTVPPRAAAPPPKAVDPKYRPSALQVTKAQQKAKNAVSALDFQDLKTAIAELQNSLALLTGENR